VVLVFFGVEIEICAVRLGEEECLVLMYEWLFVLFGL